MPYFWKWFRIFQMNSSDFHKIWNKRPWLKNWKMAVDHHDRSSFDYFFCGRSWSVNVSKTYFSKDIPVVKICTVGYGWVMTKNNKKLVLTSGLKYLSVQNIKHRKWNNTFQLIIWYLWGLFDLYNCNKVFFLSDISSTTNTFSTQPVLS